MSRNCRWHRAPSGPAFWLIRGGAVAAMAVGCAATLMGAGAPPAAMDERPSAPSNAQGDDEPWFRKEADPAALKQGLGDERVSDRWIYHDLDAARRTARQSGKPILAVFCCVPCGAAPELDGPLSTAGGGGDLVRLLDEFVAVRVVKMNGVNRHVFDFDPDVPLVAVFLDADGRVYGRYGTRASRDRKNLPRHKLSSFQQSLRRVLELHAAGSGAPLPAGNREPRRSGPAMAEDMATFQPFPEEHNPPAARNCIHCHTVGEAAVRQTMAEGRLAQRDVWPYPPAENLGLKIDVDDGLRVASVQAGSAASKTGIQAGDVLVRLDGRPLTSEADIEWALHHAPDSGAVSVVLLRDNETVEMTVALKGDWRRSDGHWRASIAPLRPNLHLRPDPYKVNKGAEPGRMGLSINYPRGEAAKAGLRNGDLLVAVDGRVDLHLESDVLKYLLLDRPDADAVELTIIRQGRRETVTIPRR